MLKNKLITSYQTGNVMFDMILGMIICSVVAQAGTFLNYKKIKKWFIFVSKYFSNNDNKIIITIECRKNGDYPETFKAVLFFINKTKGIKLNHLKYVTSTMYNYKLDEDINDDFYTFDEKKEIKLTNDYYVSFSSYEDTEKLRDGSTKKIVSFELNILTYTKSLEELKLFIQGINDEYSKFIIDKSLKNQYFIECNYNKKETDIDFKKHCFSTNRSYENVFFDQKEEVLKKIDFFLNNEDWYNKRGIPYTLGLLLHGDPGCGKTSLIKAIMKATQRHAISINLTNDFDLNKLKDLMLGDKIDNLIIPQEKRIFIMEDVDAMGDIVKDRKLKKEEEKRKVETIQSTELGKNTDAKIIEKILSEENNNNNNLSVLLNLMDGIIECPGRIIIMTTNREETLDKALKRPGRIDMKINFTKCTRSMMCNLINLFYDIKIDIKKLTKVHDFKYTPAEIMQLCFSYSNYEDLIKTL